MNEYLIAAAAREHIRDLRAAADRYRAVAESRAQRRARIAGAARER